jgi:osmotically-inducible protein OsmY
MPAVAGALHLVPGVAATSSIPNLPVEDTMQTRKKTDPEIQQDVIREFKWDPRVEETEVGVEVDNGVVTLTGSVTSWAKRMAAQEAAHRVFGVLDVANDITVKVPGSLARTDTEIAQAVREALQWDVMVPEARITSTVSQGWVTLEGTVDYGTQREDAERAVRNLMGVNGVTNKIAVATPAARAEDVRQAIEEALERRAEREARKVRVEMSDGTVTLSGVVRSWRERQAVVASARFTPGVRAVNDHLTIDPYA